MTPSHSRYEPLLKRPYDEFDERACLASVAMRPARLGGRANAVAALVAATCISIGALHPLATEAAKSAQLLECEVQSDGSIAGCAPQAGEGSHHGAGGARRVMPFHAATLTLAAELAAVAACFAVVAAAGGGSATAAARRLLDPRALAQLLPIGLVYGLGDFLQTVACNAASAPVVLVVGQGKLLMAAVLSRLLLRGDGPPTNWGRLLVISCAAAAATDIGAGTVDAERGAELRGAGIALMKAGLSSLGAVLSERKYKKADENFWVISFRVQLMMLVASLSLLPWTAADWESFTLTEFFRGGIRPLCSELLERGCAASAGGHCICVDRRGWDLATVQAVAAIVLNGLSTGLTLRYLSAVTKSVCNALSAGVFYVAYVLLGFRPFNIAQANVMAIVIISSYEYALEKTTYAAKRRCNGPLPG